LSNEAVAIARRVGEPATLAQVLLARFFTVIAPSTLGQRLVDTTELLALADRLNDPVTKCRAEMLRFRAAMEAADADEADRCLESAETLAAELGQPTIRWLVGVNRTARVIVTGRFEEAERLFLEGVDLGRAAGQADAELFQASQEFTVRFEQGRLAGMEQRLTEIVAAHPAIQFFQAELAVLYCELDRPHDARPLFEGLAARGFADVPVDTTFMLAMANAAIACVHLEDVPRAAMIHDVLAPYAEQVVFTSGGTFGAVAHHLGALAALLGQFDEGETRFATAAATHERIGAPAWLARTRLEWARMLLQTGQPRDGARAPVLLGQAHATAVDLGLRAVERQATELLGGRRS
jgi:hypothetical protein